MAKKKAGDKPRKDRFIEDDPRAFEVTKDGDDNNDEPETNEDTEQDEEA